MGKCSFPNNFNRFRKNYQLLPQDYIDDKDIDSKKYRGYSFIRSERKDNLGLVDDYWSKAGVNGLRIGED